MRRTSLALTVASFVAGSWPATSAAWIWPEHRDIAASAIESMSPERRQTLESMWAALRSDSGPQLCATLVSAGAAPTTFGDGSAVCIDYASYPAFAADHSCSLSDLRAVTETEPWGRKVVWIGAETKRRLAEAGDSAIRGNEWNRSHLEMQYVDPKYLTRSAANNAHFLIPRASIEEHEALEAYLDRALDPATPINATGVYAQYHAVALRLASRYARAPAADRPGLARRVLLAEGVALHFLEDSFAAGHYASTWGSPAWQKGTHDLYCRRGLTTMTWGGMLFASYGDAHMTPRDETVAAATLRKSLEQLTAAASGSPQFADGALTDQEMALEALDFCKAQHHPPLAMDARTRSAVTTSLRDSPIPSGGEDSIHPPRARADIGPFVGVLAGISGGGAFAGYETNSGFRFRSQLEVGGRVGYGLQGVLTTNVDGQIWAQAAFLADPAQLDASCPDCTGGERRNTALPRVPARTGLKLALRMPYFVVPFDLLILAPTLFFISKDAMQSTAFTATSGGLLNLQTPLSTGLGTFQFMAGREVGVTLRGRTDQFISTPAPEELVVVNYKSVELDFPVMEYMPPRSFATVLSLAGQVQLGFLVEFPYGQVLPQQGDAPFSGLGTSWFIYLRGRLDARKYFDGSSEDWKN